MVTKPASARPPLVLAVVSQKGGTGKTTTALNLAVAAVQAGQTVVVADLADEANSTQWFALRHDREEAAGGEGTDLLVQPTHPAGLPALVSLAATQGADLVLFDAQGGIDKAASAAVELADLVLVTCRPGMFDRNATAAAFRLCQLLQKPMRVVITNIEPGARGDIAENMRQELTEMGVDVLPGGISRRAPFVDSLNDGRGVLELQPKGKASDEVRALFSQIQNEATKLPRKHVTMVKRVRS